MAEGTKLFYKLEYDPFTFVFLFSPLSGLDMLYLFYTHTLL